MIKDYSKLGCPVIEEEDYRRAATVLPSREEVNKNTKSDSYTVFLDGNEETFVIFDWDEIANGWRLRNRLILRPTIPNMYYCTCKKMGDVMGANGINVKTEHFINKERTKKKCKVCGTVTSL